GEGARQQPRGGLGAASGDGGGEAGGVLDGLGGPCGERAEGGGAGGGEARGQDAGAVGGGVHAILLPVKQVRVPVWQAGPVCSTPSSTVSPSQSIETDTTAWWWPELSPF